MEVRRFKAPRIVNVNKKYLALNFDEDLEVVLGLVRFDETLQ